MHKKSQNFFVFLVSSIINKINTPFYIIAEIIDHLPVTKVETTELV